MAAKDPDRGRLFDRNTLDDAYTPAAVGHPQDDNIYLPAELSPPAVVAELGRRVDGLPVDHLSINVGDGTIRDVFTRGAVSAAVTCGNRIAQSSAAVSELNAWLAGLETQADAVSTELDEALDDATAVKAELDGETPQPSTEPILPRVPPALGPSVARRVLLGGVAGFTLFIDVVNFKGVLDLLNTTVSDVENRLLAAGFATATGGLAIIIGTAVGRRRRTARARRWSWLGVVLPALVLLGMMVTSFLIRALNVEVVDSDPFDLGNATAANPFGGAPGWLSAAFYTSVLMASSLASFDEARTFSRFAPYYRTRRQIKNLIGRLKRLRERLEYATNLRIEWMNHSETSVARRNLAIVDHAASCNSHFRTARALVAAKVGDPAVSDAIEHAPKIDLSTDVPPMDPPFNSPNAQPPTAAAA